MFYATNNHNLRSNIYCLTQTISGYHAFDVLKSNGLELFYDKDTQKWVVLNSSHIDKLKLYNTLYSIPTAYEYRKYYPEINCRNLNGDWCLELTPKKPRIQPYTPPSGWMSNYYQVEKLPDDPSLVKKMYTVPFLFQEQKIKEMRNRIATTLVSIVKDVMAPKSGLKGIWYSKDLKNVLKVEGLSSLPEALLFSVFEENNNKTNICGYLNEEYFENLGSWEFRLKPNKNASEAINRIFEGPSVLDCGTAIIACYYRAILEIVGEEKFNEFFNRREEDRESLLISRCTRDGKSLLSCFCRTAKETKYGAEGTFDNRPLEIGDMCAFEGVRAYHFKHPAGCARAWNVIYAGRNDDMKQTYLGLGFEKPLTEEEILDLLISEYNKERDEDDLIQIKESSQEWQDLCDPSKNIELKKFYTISHQDIEKHSTVRFFDGFFAAHATRLEAKFILALLEENDSNSIKTELLFRMDLASKAIHSGNSYRW